MPSSKTVWLSYFLSLYLISVALSRSPPEDGANRNLRSRTPVRTSTTQHSKTEAIPVTSTSTNQDAHKYLPLDRTLNTHNAKHSQNPGTMASVRRTDTENAVNRVTSAVAVVKDSDTPDKVLNSRNGAVVSPRILQGKVVPYKHSVSGVGVMKKSGANVNWSVWKGDEDESGNEISEEEAQPRWPGPPQSGWSQDPWAVDPAYLLALKNAMADMKAKEPTGLFTKLGSDPSLLIIAASIPLSLMFVAVLPVIMSKIMPPNIPMVSTTATGTRTIGQLDISPYFNPIVEFLSSAARGHPECMKKIFCQVATEMVPKEQSAYLKAVAFAARNIGDGPWMESFGIKDLVESFATGKCDNISCLSTKVEMVGNRKIRKLEEDNADR